MRIEKFSSTFRNQIGRVSENIRKSTKLRRLKICALHMLRRHNELRLGTLSVDLVCWSEMRASDFDSKIRPLTLSAVRERKELLFENVKENMRAELIPQGTGHRFFCTVTRRPDTPISMEEAKGWLKKMEAFGIQTVNDFLTPLVSKDVWIYFYPIWSISKIKPSYRRLAEIEVPLGVVADDLLYMDPKEIKEIYPIDVTTPEAATEELPSRAVIFDPRKRREANVIVARALSLVLGASTEVTEWFRQVVITRVEPRPYVSFGDVVPKKAQAIGRFPVFYRIQLVSGKGWTDNMIVLEEALASYSTLGKFSQMEEDVKQTVLLGLSAAMLTVALGILAINYSIYVLILACLLLLDSGLFVTSRLLLSKFPVFSRKASIAGAWLLYFLFVVLIAYVVSMVAIGSSDTLPTEPKMPTIWSSFTSISSNLNMLK